MLYLQILLLYYWWHCGEFRGMAEQREVPPWKHHWRCRIRCGTDDISACYTHIYLASNIDICGDVYVWGTIIWNHNVPKAVKNGVVILSGRLPLYWRRIDYAGTSIIFRFRVPDWDSDYAYWSKVWVFSIRRWGIYFNRNLWGVVFPSCCGLASNTCNDCCVNSDLFHWKTVLHLVEEITYWQSEMIMLLLAC